MDWLKGLSAAELFSAAVLTLGAIALTTRFLTSLQFGNALSSGGRRPRVLPYWEPWLGHSYELTFDRKDFLKAARDSTLNTIFAVKIAGGKCSVIYLPHHIRQLDNLISAKDVGFKSKKTAIACGVPKLETAHIANDTSSSFQKYFSERSLQEEMIRRMMTNLQTMLPQLVSFLPTVVDQFAWERGAVYVSKTSSGEDAVVVNLQSFLPNFLVHTVTPVVTGAALLETFPTLLSTFQSFKFAFNLMGRGLPRWLPIPRLTTAHISRKKLLDNLETFHGALKANHSDSGSTSTGEWGEMTDVSPAMLYSFTKYEKYNLPLRTRAALDLSNLTTLNLGINEICVKALIRIIATPGLADKIRAETKSFAKATQPPVTFGIAEPPRLTFDLAGLTNSCPLLRSCIVETIRLDTFPEVTGRLTKPIKLSAPGSSIFSLQKDDRVMVAPGLYFTDPASFVKPDSWDPARHETESERATEIERIWEDTKGYPRSSDPEQPSFMMQQCLLFLAGILALWDIELLVKEVKELKAGLEMSSLHARIRKRNLEC